MNQSIGGVASLRARRAMSTKKRDSANTDASMPRSTSAKVASTPKPKGQNGGQQRTRKSQPEAVLPRYSDQELREFVLGVCDGHAFTSMDIKDPNLLGTVFMPLALGALSDMPKDQIEDIGCVWEWRSQAMPMGINGMPMFPSCRLMGRADFLKAGKAIRAELERRKNIAI